MALRETMPFDLLSLKPASGVRNLYPWESIPAYMDAGFERLDKLDRNWAWGIFEGGEMMGLLLASPCHGAAALWRIKVLPGVRNGAYRLLKKFVIDCRQRGIRGFITIADLETETGMKLKSIVERCGGKAFGNVTLLSAPLPKMRGGY